MNANVNEIELNGVSYVRKDMTQPQFATNKDGLQCVIVAAGIGGIHFGFLKSRQGQEVVLVHARRIQYWSGAASISEMSLKGVSNPNDCRFSAAVPEIILLSVVEVIPVCDKAEKNLSAVPIWTR